MAELSFSLPDLFEKAFGYRTQAFSPEFAPVNGFQPTSRLEQGSYGSPYYSKNSLGVEYFMPVTMLYPAGSGSGSLTNSANPQGSLQRWNLPYPVVSISTRKTIVETKLTERRGTVKELINTQDFEIVVKGLLIAPGNEFPENDMKTLRDIYELNMAISIQSALTDIFLIRPDRTGSDQVVIRDLRFQPIKGIKNIRPYELTLLSDEAFNLQEIS